MEKRGRDLTVDQVAGRLGLTPRQVRNLIYDGKLRGWQPSERRLLIPEASLEAYLAALNP